MKLITRDTDYALRALCILAKSRRSRFAVCQLAKELGIPLAFLRKAMQHLNNKGVLVSRKGAGGGFSLAKPADKIFLADLIEVFQGPFKLNECSFKKKRCPRVKKCLLKKKIDEIQRYVSARLKAITLASLIER